MQIGKKTGSYNGGFSCFQNKDPANLLCQLTNRSELVAELWVEQPFHMTEIIIQLFDKNRKTMTQICLVFDKVNCTNHSTLQRDHDIGLTGQHLRQNH